MCEILLSLSQDKITGSWNARWGILTETRHYKNITWGSEVICWSTSTIIIRVYRHKIHKSQFTVYSQCSNNHIAQNSVLFPLCPLDKCTVYSFTRNTHRSTVLLKIEYREVYFTCTRKSSNHVTIDLHSPIN